MLRDKPTRAGTLGAAKPRNYDIAACMPGSGFTAQGSFAVKVRLEAILGHKHINMTVDFYGNLKASDIEKPSPFDF